MSSYRQDEKQGEQEIKLKVLGVGQTWRGKQKENEVIGRRKDNVDEYYLKGWRIQQYCIQEEHLLIYVTLSPRHHPYIPQTTATTSISLFSAPPPQPPGQIRLKEGGGVGAGELIEGWKRWGSAMLWTGQVEGQWKRVELNFFFFSPQSIGQRWGTFLLSRAIMIFITSFAGHTTST